MAQPLSRFFGEWLYHLLLDQRTRCRRFHRRCDGRRRPARRWRTKWETFFLPTGTFIDGYVNDERRAIRGWRRTFGQRWQPHRLGLDAAGLTLFSSVGRTSLVGFVRCLVWRCRNIYALSDVGQVFHRSVLLHPSDDGCSRLPTCVDRLDPFALVRSNRTEPLEVCLIADLRTRAITRRFPDRTSGKRWFDSIAERTQRKLFKVLKKCGVGLPRRLNESQEGNWYSISRVHLRDY